MQTLDLNKLTAGCIDLGHGGERAADGTAVDLAETI